MAHEETIYGLMESLVIADKHVIGDIMAHKGIWTEGTSASNNADKVLKVLCDYNRLEKVEGFYRLIGCRSNYCEHARALTAALSSILKQNCKVRIYREKTLSILGLRPDAIVFLSRDNHGLVFILEICLNESPESIQNKVSAWHNFDGALAILSQIFGLKVLAFDIVVSGDISAEGTFEFNQFLKDIKEVNQ